MKRNCLLTCGIVMCLFSPIVREGAIAGPQNDLSAKVLQAVSLPFPKQAAAARNQLLAFEARAIPCIIEIVRGDENLTPIKRTFLIGVIASMDGQQPASALISLMTDERPFVRGLAVSHLGKQRQKAAIPHLINLLNDKEVYIATFQTDRAAEQAVLVRDVAIEALQATTGITLAPRGSKHEQAEAWVLWWQKQQESNGGLRSSPDSSSQLSATAIAAREITKATVVVPGDWREVRLEHLSFYAPPEVQPRRVRGADSAVWEYSSKDLELTIDLGPYSSKPEALKDELDFKEEQIKIDSKDATLCSFRPRNPAVRHRPYVVAVYFPNVGMEDTRLSFSANYAYPEGEELARKIFRSIRFN